MIGRRQIREKVLQAIYAHNLNEIPLLSTEKNFFSAIQDVYDLYVFQINLIIEVRDIAIKKIESSKKKNFKTDSDLNPILNFVNNQVIKSLDENLERKTYTKNHKELTWILYEHYPKVIFKNLITSEFYTQYMDLINPTFEQDQKLVVKMFEQFIAYNESLHELFEELQLSWADDLHIANAMTIKTLKHLNSETETHTLIKTIKNSEDKEFAADLLKKTVNYRNQFYQIIEQRAIGWEMDRIAIMDKIILSMAFCELNYIKTPSLVVINEYIELAKAFSIANSKIYINGILDKYVRDNNLKESNEIVPKDGEIIDIEKKKLVKKSLNYQEQEDNQEEVKEKPVKKPVKKPRKRITL